MAADWTKRLQRPGGWIFSHATTRVKISRKDKKNTILYTFRAWNFTTDWCGRDVVPMLQKSSSASCATPRRFKGQLLVLSSCQPPYFCPKTEGMNNRYVHVQCIYVWYVHVTVNHSPYAGSKICMKTPTCSYCDELNDSIHFFFLCPETYSIWLSFSHWWNTNTPTGNPLYLTILPEGKQIIFGITSHKSDPYVVLNYCIMHVKYHIYKQKLSHLIYSHAMCNHQC